MGAKIVNISLDAWSGVHCTEDTIHHPTIDDVRIMFSSLDGKVHTILSIYNDAGSYLTIGGGPDRFIVYLTEVCGKMWNLVNDSDARDEIIPLNAGGQVGDFRASQTATREVALQAITTFCETGAFDPRLLWEQQM